MAYYNTDKNLSNIHLPKVAILCKEANCKSIEHKRETSVPCMTMSLRPLYDGGKPFYNLYKQNKKSNIRPAWNEHVAMHHTEAPKAYKLWVIAGKPRQGPELQHKKLSKARFKYAVRFISRNEQAMRGDSIANNLMCNNVTDFWKAATALNSCKPSLPCTVEGVSGADSIAELWRQHYNSC